MIAGLPNHLWQSTLFALAAGLLAIALRNNRAEIRYAVWLTASLKFFVPFSLLMSVGSYLAPSRAVPEAAMPPPTTIVVVDQIAQPFGDVFPATTSPLESDPLTDWIPLTIFILWICGSAAIMLTRLQAWRRIRAAVRASAPVDIAFGQTRIAVRSAPGLLEPGVVGLWRPVLLMPAGIHDYLPPPQLEAVIAHEVCHIRRRDNLTAALHMIVEAIFWFHPLVWWIGARLVHERERACDEHVLRTLGEPRAYAEGILNVCKRYVESPLSCVAGVTGSDLKRRVAHIMTNQIGLRLNRARRMALTLAAVTALGIPVIAGAITQPLRARSSAQLASARATFDVASVKPCQANDLPPGALGRRVDTSLNRVYFECYTVASLIDMAYMHDGDLRLNKSGPDRNIRGGPDWIRSERYTIEGTTTAKQWTGAMLRALLEDRFRLRSTRATEQVPLYGLTVAKGGLKIKPIADDGCVDDDRVTSAAAASEKKPLCGSVRSGRRGTTRTWDLGGASLDALADVLETDRQVLDQTGVSGRFNIHLEYDLDPMTTTGATVFTAVEEQLGLKLAQTRGAHEYLVVDHIERPVPDTEVRQTASASGLPATPVQTTAQAPSGNGMQITFDVVSIKPCLTDAPTNGRGGSTSMRFSISPGYAHWGCVSLSELVEIAWSGPFPVNTLLNTQRLPPGRRPDLPERVRGGATWVRDERFEIEIRMTGDVSGLTGSARHDQVTLAMRPALQTMLADRFQLKLRKATEEQSMYAMTVAKSGLKITPSATATERCWQIPPDTARGSQPVAPPGFEGAPPCHYSMNAGTKAGNKFWDIKYISLKDFAKLLSGTVDRYVLDRTGADARFSFTLEYTPDDRTPGDTYDPFTRLRAERGAPPQPPGTAPSIFRALEALGLHLDPVKGPAEYFLIESAQRPKPNFP
jgi:bla regulator protein blaR1